MENENKEVIMGQGWPGLQATSLQNLPSVWRTENLQNSRVTKSVRFKESLALRPYQRFCIFVDNAYPRYRFGPLAVIKKEELPDTVRLSEFVSRP